MRVALKLFYFCPRILKICLLCVFFHYSARVTDRVEYNLKTGSAEAMEVVAPMFGYEPLRPNIFDLEAEHVAESAALRVGRAPALIRAIMHHESRGKADAVSEVGAISYMQVMAFNAKRCGLTVGQLKEKVPNINCGAQIIDEDIVSQDEDVEKGLQQYNGGPKCVKVIEKCGTNITCMGYVSPKKRGCAESYLFAKNVLSTMSRDIR